MSQTKKVFIFKVALQGDEDIWRRIAVREDQTLDDLHRAIVKAFDRDDDHLYSFYVPRPQSRKKPRRRNRRDAVDEYVHPFEAEPNPMQETFYAMLGQPKPSTQNAAKVKIRDLKLVPKQVFEYLFDYGDCWWHDITVDETDVPAEAGAYPRILEVYGKSPPQYPEADRLDEDEDEDYDEGDEEA